MRHAADILARAMFHLNYDDPTSNDAMLLLWKARGEVIMEACRSGRYLSPIYPDGGC